MTTTGNKILIIDDDARNIFALSAVLKAKGFTCLPAYTAQDGLAILQHTKDITVVLLDMMMPEMDGYEAVDFIRNTPEIAGTPVIAVTAQAMVGDREKTLKAGANAYLSKPVDVDELLKLLAQFIH